MFQLSEDLKLSYVCIPKLYVTVPAKLRHGGTKWNYIQLLHPVTKQVISQYWNRRSAFCKLHHKANYSGTSVIWTHLSRFSVDPSNCNDYSIRVVTIKVVENTDILKTNLYAILRLFIHRFRDKLWAFKTYGLPRSQGV